MIYIFKKGDPSLFRNIDRPISLLPIISKVLEKTIYIELYAYFNDSKFYFDNQYGFKQKQSTEYASLELVDRIITQMDKNDVPFRIYLYLSKAFEIIDHSMLFSQLRYYGLGRSILKIFKSYLNDRSQYVEFENAKSDILSINIGAPQGSVLGPLLFILYMNDFPKASKMFNFTMYADATPPYLAPSNPLIIIYQIKTLSMQ